MAGGGPLQIHPLIKTYDEAKRGADRLRQYLDTYGKEITKGQTDACLHIIEHLKDVQTMIPKEYQKTVWELRKERGE